MKTIKTYFAILFCIATALPVLAQEELPENLDDLSLEELMQIPINSASKKDETLFDAPLSSYTITRQDIERAGSTSIMEALRLAPGVIVREQSNGAYDIHIRGFDNVLRYSEPTTKANLATLVMIDNRPVFNHNLGGTFWEALPIDLNDVERIEIVRGPSAPLFGPNAVTGVINIITRSVDKGKTLVNANVQAGTAGTTIANLTAGKNHNRFSFLLSGNYQKRDRFQNTYYLPATADYKTVDELEAIFGENIRKQYSEPERAWDKFGVNASAEYRVSEKINFDVSAGTQRSEVQKVFLSNIFNGSIPFTDNETNTTYVNVSGKANNLSFRSSYLSGFDNLAVNAMPNRYDYNVIDAFGEYSIGLGKIGAIVPGVSFQKATLSDDEYAKEGLSFLGGTSASITTTSAFVRTDLHPVKSLRVIAAIRADQFSDPDDVYFAYEFAATYKLNEQNIVRAAMTRSNSGSFVGYNHLNLSAPIAPGVDFVRSGSTDLDLYTVKMIEAGYRTKLSRSFHIDFDVFRQTVENLTALLVTNGIDPGNGSFQPIRQEFRNVPTTATQTGATIAINFAPDERFHLKPFATFQKTDVKDLPSSFLEPTLASNIGAPVAYSSSEHKNTPSFYGGFYANFKATRSFNVNLTGYFFSNHRQYDNDDTMDTRPTGDISGKMLLNTKVSYSFGKVTIFANARNAFNSKSREYYGADRTSGLYLAGASFSM